MYLTTINRIENEFSILNKSLRIADYLFNL